MSNLNLNKQDIFKELNERIAKCQACGLCKTRTNTVPSKGNSNAKIMLIGEGPGADEDLQGLPFVGAAGQLLHKILKAAGINSDELFFTNVVKCRTDENNRNPSEAEIFACNDFLETQLFLIHPELVIAVGGVATQTLLRISTGIMTLHGKIRNWRGIRLFPMIHPSYLLRNPDKSSDPGSPRYKMWEDAKLLKKYVDEVNLNG